MEERPHTYFDCPCCGLPTLGELNAYEICPVCWWEDDGQGDRDADVVRGGPNYEYSLTAARKNFAAHGHMYDKGRGIDVVELEPGTGGVAVVCPARPTRHTDN
jgi:hypothetical protein